MKRLCFMLALVLGAFPVSADFIRFGGGLTPGVTKFSSGTNCIAYANSASTLACQTWLAANDSGAGTPTITFSKTMSGASATSNHFNLTATLPSTLSAATHAANYQITGAGSSAQEVTGLRLNMLAGYTGTANSYGIIARHSFAQNLAASNLADYSAGIAGEAEATSGTKLKVGVVGRVYSNPSNGAGVFGIGTGGNTNSVGVLGTVQTGTGSNFNAAVYAHARANLGAAHTWPTATAALVANNVDSTADIFVAMDNNTPVFTIADGGLTTLSGGGSLRVLSTGSGTPQYFTVPARTGTGTGALIVGDTAASSWSSGTNLTSVGVNSCAGISTATGATCLGASTTVVNANFQIALGVGATTTAANQMAVGGSGGAINDVYWGESVTDASPPATVTHNATGGSGTNIAGGAFLTAGGKGTGNASGGAVRTQTSVPGASGTTLQTLGDRYFINGGYVTLTEASPTIVGTCTLPSDTGAGGDFLISAFAADASAEQTRTLHGVWSAVNNAGTLTSALSTPVEAVAVTTGTLTCTITLTDGGSGALRFNANCTSSLTQTTLVGQVHIRKNFGTGTCS